MNFVLFLVMSTHLVEEFPGARVPDAGHPVPASRHNLGIHSIGPDIRLHSFPVLASQMQGIRSQPPVTT